MLNLRRSLPSMSALATFEAAARLGSFTHAASELGVTQAAVSRQIKLMEVELNTRLFVRANRRVALTSSGKALASTVSNAFNSMAEMIETVRQPISTDTVTVGASIAFSHFWILPRLAGFRTRHPEIRLKLVADDSVTDLRHDRLDLAIRFGKPPFSDGESIASTPDSVFPVCSPKLLKVHKMTRQSANLLQLPLIASDSVNPTWLTWRSWAQAVGMGGAFGKAGDLSQLRFNHYIDTIQAALNGEGVALGWSTLLGSHIQEGRLVTLGTGSLTLEERYHALVPVGREMSGPAKLFLSWVGENFSAE